MFFPPTRSNWQPAASSLGLFWANQRMIVSSRQDMPAGQRLAERKIVNGNVRILIMRVSELIVTSETLHRSFDWKNEPVQGAVVARKQPVQIGGLIQRRCKRVRREAHGSGLDLRVVPRQFARFGREFQPREISGDGLEYLAEIARGVFLFIDDGMCSNKRLRDSLGSLPTDLPCILWRRRRRLSHAARIGSRRCNGGRHTMQRSEPDVATAIKRARA